MRTVVARLAPGSRRGERTRGARARAGALRPARHDGGPRPRRSASRSGASSTTSNKTVGTLETRVLVTARRFLDHGVVGGRARSRRPVDLQPRTLNAPELTASDGHAGAGRRLARRRTIPGDAPARPVSAAAARPPRGLGRADVADRAGRSAPPAGPALARRRRSASCAAAQPRSAGARRRRRPSRGRPGGERRAASRRAAASGARRGRSRSRAARAACRRAGTRPPSSDARPHCGHSCAGWSAPSWCRSSSTRASEAAVSVSAQPDAARPFVPASSRQRSSASCSSAASASSSSGCTTSSSSFGPLCASASVAPTTTLLTSCGSASRNSERVSSEPTTTTFGVCSRRHGAVELRGDVLQVLGDELLDVALVARLRPAALVVAARLVLGAVDDLLEPPGAQPEDLAALAADERRRSRRRRGRRAARAARGGSRGRRATSSGTEPATRQRPEEVAGREDGQPAGAFTAELVVEELADPREVPLQPLPLGRASARRGGPRPASRPPRGAS